MQVSNSFHFVFLIWLLLILITWLKQSGFKNKLSTYVTFTHWFTKKFEMKAGLFIRIALVCRPSRSFTFLGECQIYFIEWVEKLSSFTSAKHEWKCWCFQHMRWNILIYLPKIQTFFYIMRIMLNRSRFKYLTFVHSISRHLCMVQRV